MNRFSVILLAGALALSCTQHFISSSSLREGVHEDYVARSEVFGGAFAPYMAVPQEASSAEREAMEFLYAYMPSADVMDYPAEFFLENVRASFRAREELGWKMPEYIFRHYVLPLRVNNENLDSCRTVFYRELKPRVEGLSMQEAILEVNHWCHEKVTYQPSDARTTSPLNTVKNALGRCGEESTFTVAALRSVGIPARQVYTPRWAHTDDNHAWVEAWADGRWWFLGACEPEPVLNLGWFNAPASRAMLMHTRVFGRRYDGPEEVVLPGPNYTEVNLIDNYAETARVDFTVLLADGSPASGARVDFCIYNYAEFYPAVTKYTDAAGHTFLSSGLGDLMVWASLDGAFGYSKVSFGTDSDVVITLGAPASGVEQLMITPPAGADNMPPVSAEQRALNDARFAREDSLRHAYEATFPSSGDEFVLRSRGNWEVIRGFLDGASDRSHAIEVLSSLSGKDLRDITPVLLADAYDAPRPYRGFRVEDEFLSPFYGFFASAIGPEDDAAIGHSEDSVLAWISSHVSVDNDPAAWRIPMSPAGVWKCRVADPRSLDIFTVALLRARGLEAYKDPVTGKLGHEAAPKGVLKLSYEPCRSVANPRYYSHFTLSRLENGRPHLMSFDEGEVDMGGGVDWLHTFRDGCALEEGTYLLVSGNRLSSGAVPVTMRFVEVRAGETTVEPLVIDEPAGTVPVIGSFDSEQRFLAFDGGLAPDGTGGLAGEPCSILSRTGRGYYVVALLEPGKEPTNHVLRDLAAEKAALEAWGRPIVLLCPSEESLERLLSEAAAGRYGTLPSTVQFGVETAALVSAATVSAARPVVLLADTFNRVFFRSEGYTIGLGTQLITVISRL